MKLKKIASLALAGLMAVGMLAGCGSSEPTNNNDDKSTAVTGSLSADFVAEVNKKIAKKADSDVHKITLTEGDSSTISSQLKSYVEKNSSDNLIKAILNDAVEFPEVTQADFKDHVSADTTHIYSLMDNNASIAEGKTYKAVRLFAFDSSITNDAIVDALVEKLTNTMTNTLPKEVQLNLGQNQTKCKCSYTASVVYVEDSLSNAQSFNNGRAVKYVAVLVTGVANK